MGELKLLLFVAGSWLFAILGMELYFATFLNMELWTDKQRQLIHTSATSMMILAVCIYIIWQYPYLVTESRHAGPKIFVGMTSGVFFNMLFNPVYETWIDYKNGDFD